MLFRRRRCTAARRR